MAVTDILPAPPENSYLRGQDALHRYVICDASASAPVAWTNLSYVQSVVVGDVTYGVEYDIRHHGAGDKTHVKREPMWPVTINVLNGKKAEVLAALQNITWSSASVALPYHVSNDTPDCIIESIFREADYTHRFSQVIQDLIIDDTSQGIPMEYEDGVITGHTYYPPFYVYAGYEAVYDVWDATPTTLTYTLSCSTPASMVTATDHNWWELDNAAFVKLWDNSADGFYRYTTGVAISGGTLTVTGATPSATDKVYTLYVKATS